MNIDTIARIVAMVAATVLILSNVNLSYLYSYFKNYMSREGDKFLEIVSLWHELRDKCQDANLVIAVKKLDETFPLLNQEEKEDNV